MKFGSTVYMSVADPGISKLGGAVHCWRLRFVLMPIHTYPMFCSESREQSAYVKHCLMDTIEVYACYTVKILNTTPPQKKKNSKRGARAGAGSAFACTLSCTCIFP